MTPELRIMTSRATGSMKTRRILVTTGEHEDFEIVGIYDVPANHNVDHKIQLAVKERQRRYAKHDVDFDNWVESNDASKPSPPYPPNDIADYLPKKWKRVESIKTYHVPRA